MEASDKTKKLAEAIEICGDAINPGLKGMNINSAVTGLNVINSEMVPAMVATCTTSGAALAEVLLILDRHGGEVGAKAATRIRTELVHVMFDVAEKLWTNRNRPGWQAMVRKMMDVVALFDPAQIDNRTNQSPAYFALIHAWKTNQLQ